MRADAFQDLEASLSTDSLIHFVDKSRSQSNQIGGQLRVAMIGAAKLHCKGEREREEEEIIVCLQSALGRYYHYHTCLTDRVPEAKNC